MYFYSIYQQSPTAETYIMLLLDDHDEKNREDVLHRGYLTVIVEQTTIRAVANVFINYNSHKRRTIELLTEHPNRPP